MIDKEWNEALKKMLDELKQAANYTDRLSLYRYTAKAFAYLTQLMQVVKAYVSNLDIMDEISPEDYYNYCKGFIDATYALLNWNQKVTETMELPSEVEKAAQKIKEEQRRPQLYDTT